MGTPDFEFSKYFTLYPNPANDKINIKANVGIVMKSINIYNTLGQLVLAIIDAQSVEAVDVSNLEVGNYFMKIISDKGSAVSKFVKK